MVGGGIPPLVELTRSGTDEAMLVPTTLCPITQHNLCLAGANRVLPACALSPAKTKLIPVAMLMILAAHNADNKVAIAAAGGIVPLVELMRSGTASAKVVAVGVLMVLAHQNADNQVEIAAVGGIVPLVELARSGTAVAKHAAIALQCLEENADNRKAISAAKVAAIARDAVSFYDRPATVAVPPVVQSLLELPDEMIEVTGDHLPRAARHIVAFCLCSRRLSRILSKSVKRMERRGPLTDGENAVVDSFLDGAGAPSEMISELMISELSATELQIAASQMDWWRLALSPNKASVTRENLSGLVRNGGEFHCAVLDFYLELLNWRVRARPELPRCHFFNSFFFDHLTGRATAASVQQLPHWTWEPPGYDYDDRIRRWPRWCASLFEQDLVLFPVHVYGDNRWCLAVANFRDKRLEFYPSSHTIDLGENVLTVIRRYLHDEHLDKLGAAWNDDEWIDCHFKDLVRQQEEGSNGGVFLCKIADYLSQGDAVLDFTAADMEYFRRRLVYEVYTVGLLDDLTTTSYMYRHIHPYRYIPPIEPLA